MRSVINRFGRDQSRNRLILLGNILLIVTSVVMISPKLISQLMANFGMLKYGSILYSEVASSKIGAEHYPYIAVLDEQGDYYHEIFQRALEFDSSNHTASWGLIRTSLAIDQPELTADIAMSVASNSDRNDLLFLDLLFSFVQRGEAAMALRLYEERAASTLVRPISDIIALAYLKTEKWEQVLSIRPNDLYSNYQLWRSQIEAGLEESPEFKFLINNIQDFSWETSSLSHPDVLALRISIIPDLVRDNLWDSNLAKDVVSYLVWKQYSSPDVENMLLRMAQMFPDEPQWTFFLGEMYHRRGKYDQAENLYHRTDQITENNWPAYLRLGLLNAQRLMDCQTDCLSLLEAKNYWYKKYEKAIRNEKSDLENQNEFLSPTSDGECANPNCWLANEKSFIAQSLDIPQESILLGHNLISNGNFQSWDNGIPIGWRTGLSLGQDNDGGIYAFGEDDLVSVGSAARISAVRGVDHPGQSTTLAEYVGDTFTVEDKLYLVGLRYLFLGTPDGDLSLFIGDYTHEGDDVLIKRDLDSSVGGWRNFHAVVDGQGIDSELSPVIQLLNQGQLWISEISVRAINIP